MNPDFNDRRETLENLKTDVWVAYKRLQDLVNSDISAKSDEWIIDQIVRAESFLNDAKLKLNQ